MRTLIEEDLKGARRTRSDIVALRRLATSPWLIGHLTSTMTPSFCQPFELVAMAILGMGFQNVFNESAWEDWTFWHKVVCTIRTRT